MTNLHVSCSCTEGNLLSICASFPTIRRFFRLVAPRWIGESEKKSSHNNVLDQHGPSEEHPFRTFGAASTRKKLDTIGLTRHEDSEELELGAGEPTKVKVYGGGKRSVGREPSRKLESDDDGSGSGCSIASSLEIGPNKTWDPRPVGGDGEAERTIVQTKSYRVTRHSRTNS